MKTFPNASILSVAALALVVAAPAAFADNITVVGSSIPATTPVSSAMGTISVAQFNNVSGIYAGDTLNSIDITLSGSGSVTYTAELIANGGSGGNLTINTLTSSTTLKLTGATSPVNLLLSNTYTPGSPIFINTPGLAGEVIT